MVTLILLLWLVMVMVVVALSLLCLLMLALLELEFVCRGVTRVDCRLARHSLRFRIFAIRAHVHIVIVVSLLFERWPSLLADKAIVMTLVLRVINEKGLRCGRYVLSLVEAAVLYVFLHSFAHTHMHRLAHNSRTTIRLICIVQHV